MKSIKMRYLLGALALALILALASPAIIHGFWKVRSSNPVRRGIVSARELGCFRCHGALGQGGVPDPGKPDENIPAWNGGVWMMYVKNDDAIRKYIREGTVHAHEHGDEQGGGAGHRGIEMPAYGNMLDDGELNDLVATFKVLSGMSVTPAGSPARRGADLARKWNCFSCHGPAGSGGLPNPGSFAGFIPGWYGADFNDLVRDREEFEAWIREGSIKRLSLHPLASIFIKRQKVLMPAYAELTVEEVDDLWAYAQWLAETSGGSAGELPW
ncbi:MAG: c-type cytochrome [Acidobacteria bacterium]|uniref:C-type cytochrome n=1 Tax=Candidatus Polarisedimenticola svalbardensis TaxID=2886004 RepID=A0A8J6Y9B3_9BACT|nr:c-type cytochrome [Candidatus Polarisedimenticola svalbardensis]